jgi:outer membrane lipoprotein SlyB
MEDNKTSNRIHPLVAGAAISVMLVSLTGVAAISGLIPNSHSNGAGSKDITPMSAPAVATAASSPVALLGPQDTTSRLAEPKSRPAPEPERHTTAPRATEKSHSQPRQSSRNSERSYQQSEPVRVAEAPKPILCVSCGRIESVQAIQQEAAPSGIGMVAGAVLGGVLGNQVGGGTGRKIATVAGAVGGGYAGNHIEKRTRAITSYSVRVRMEDGSLRSFPYNDQPDWSVGDRVRVIDGQLTSRA